jgi:hypothetical protein
MSNIDPTRVFMVVFAIICVIYIMIYYGDCI